MDKICIALNKESEIPIDKLEIFLEKTCAAAVERPLDEKIIRILKKLSALLWQRYQISRVSNQNKPLTPILVRSDIIKLCM